MALWRLTGLQRRKMHAVGFALAVGLALTAGRADALDLAAAWELARASDPQLRAARAQTLAERERVPQARSRLMPVLSAQVTRHRNDLQTEGPDLFGQPATTETNYTSRGEVLSLRQPIYRPALWAQLEQAHHLVAAADARLEAQTQDLLDRLGKAYFAALLAQDQTQVIAQQIRAYGAQLESARRSLAAGSGTRTDIDEAQARLDLAHADELAVGQALDLARRELEVLIGQPAVDLAPVDAARLRTVPGAGELTHFTELAEQASPEVRSLTEEVRAARRELEVAQAGHYPTVDAVAQYSRSDSENITRVNSTYQHGQVGFVLTIPLYQGGLVNSQVRQALARQERAESRLEALRRELGVRVHREFRGVSEGAARIGALEQAVLSAEQLVTSNERSFAAGFRTRVDVLEAQRRLAATRRDLAQARYQYLVARLGLGTLTGVPVDVLVSQLNATLRP